MKIEELLKDYFEGQTTLEQERQIRRWFAATPLEKMSQEQRELAPLFGAFNAERMELAQREKEASAKLPQAKDNRRWIWFAASGAVAAALLVGIFINTYRPTISVEKEPAITMTIGGVAVEGDAAAKEFANEQMKKLSRMMNRNTIDQKIGIFRKMVLRAENLLNNTVEDNTEETQEENTQE